MRAKHKLVYKDIVKLMIIGQDKKLRSVWNYGDPNTGKTEINNKIAEIFHTVEYDETAGSFATKI